MTAQRHKKKKSYRWFMLLRIFGIVLFIIVLFNVDLKSIWENIRQVSPLYFILGLLSQAALLLIKGWRWHIMNRGRSNIKSPMQSMGEFLESYAIGVITPGRLGELMKAGYQSDRAAVFASGLRVFAERGLDVGFFVIVSGAALGFAKPIPFPESLSFLIMGAGIVILIIAVLLIGNKQTTAFISRIFRKFSSNYFNLDLIDTTAVIILSLFSNAFAFVSCYFLALGILMPISLLSISGGVAIAGLFNMLPITVMGLGTREVTFLYIFQVFPEAQVLALSALIFIIAQIGGGLLALLLGQFFLFKAKNKTV